MLKKIAPPAQDPLPWGRVPRGCPPAEGEEDFPVVVVGDGAGVEDVVGDFKTEADIRRRVKIGDVEHVASKTLQTGLSVVSARTQSRMFPNLHRTTPLRTRGMRSNK